MNLDPRTLRDVCQLLGGLMLRGSDVAMLDGLRKERRAERLGRAIGGSLGELLVELQEAMEKEPPESLAVEYTRLVVADGTQGARRPVPVPPWEDCYTSGARTVLGERSRAALQAYVTAGLGYDGIKAQPADHIGLELCFVATLLDEECRGERDAKARAAFVTAHLSAFGPKLGQAMSAAAKDDFWRSVGRAIAYAPACLRQSGPPELVAASP